MAEFSGEVSIFESQSLALTGESLDISSDRFDALTFNEPLSENSDPSLTKTGIRERKRRRIKQLKESHAQLKKLSAIGQEEKIVSRFEKLSSIKKQAALADPLLGTIIDGKYEIVGIVGKGANATVYKAIRYSHEDVVAIKTLRNKRTEDILRFNIEIEAIEKLKHQNLVEFIDCVRLDDNQTFLIMELVKGVSLQEVLKLHGPILDEETIWFTLRQISDALLHAHMNGIIHRDLKSGNVVLSKEVNRPLVVKVLDFGLARQSATSGITMHGITLGSPLYMSPEQCRGEEPSRQSDIYSLGILSYEVVAGVVPFIGDTIADIMAAHCDPNLTHIPISEINPSLKKVEWFDRLLSKALTHRTEYRFKTVEEFQDSLDKWIKAVRAG